MSDFYADCITTFSKVCTKLIYIQQQHLLVSLIFRFFLTPVFDRLQYAKKEGEGLVNLNM